MSLVFVLHIPAYVLADEGYLLVGRDDQIVATRCIVQYSRFHSTAIFCR